MVQGKFVYPFLYNSRTLLYGHFINMPTILVWPLLFVPGKQPSQSCKKSLLWQKRNKKTEGMVKKHQQCTYYNMTYCTSKMLSQIKLIKRSYRCWISSWVSYISNDFRTSSSLWFTARSFGFGPAKLIGDVIPYFLSDVALASTPEFTAIMSCTSGKSSDSQNLLFKRV